MINLNSDKGVTLVMLIVTIIVLLIIAGISITLSIDSIDQTTDAQDKSEMLIIQHAINERYVEYMQTNKEEILVGIKTNKTITEKTSEEFYDYTISRNAKLSELETPITGIEYYIAYNDAEQKSTLYYYKDALLIEIEKYRNSILVPESLTKESGSIKIGEIEYPTIYKIENFDDIKINCLIMLGVTGQGVNKSDFKVNYKTGYVEEIGASKILNGYNKDTENGVNSNMIDIY